jgi:branched-chain amino acid transport system substrate-binding protein
MGLGVRGIVLCAAAVVAWSGCTKKETPPAEQKTPGQAPAAQAATQGPIVVGMVAPLSGEIATFGTGAQLGVKLAIEEANAAGGVKGRKIELKVLDDQGKPEEAVTAATRLVTEDKAVAIVGEITSTSTLAVAPIMDTNKVPAVTPSATNPKVTKDGEKTRPYMFRVCFIDPFQGTVAAKHARQNLKVARAAILRDVGSDYSVGLADFFTRTFTELGGQIVADVTYKAGDQDFKSQLTRVKAAKPDVIYLPGYYTDVALIARQARELGIKVPFGGGDGWDSAKLYEIAQGALDGSFFSNHYTAENPAPVVQEFVKKFQQANGNPPDAFAALGYDAARMILDAMNRAPEITPTAIRDALEQTKGLQGVTGTLALDENHNPVKSAVILGIEKNAPKFVATVEP